VKYRESPQAIALYVQRRNSSAYPSQSFSARPCIAPDKSLGGLCVSPFLKEYINNFTVLVNGSPQVMLLPLDSHEHLINEESIAVALVLSSQSLSKLRT
jgi:hypothetical protein